MLTYVINTSENKTFDSNLLFELVGYSQIRWKHSGLDKIQECAEEICTEEKSKILSTGDYRVVVLVDFFEFPHTDAAQADAGSYVELYKGFLEYYLMEHLFQTLKKNNIPAKACEIYYIQYVPHEPLAQNRMAKEQTARMLLGWESLAEYYRLKREAEWKTLGDPQVAHGDEAEAQLPTVGKKKAREENFQGDAGEEEKTVTSRSRVFTLLCAGGVCLDFTFAHPMTFEDFYEYHRNHRDDPRKFGITVHKPYVTYGDASRAAYDALSLSLYLVHLYERREESGVEEEIRRPNDRVFVNILRSSLRKVHSARSVALKNDCRYYKLDYEGKRKPDVSLQKDRLKREEKLKKETARLTEAEQYRYICRLADQKGGKPDEELIQKRDEIMRSYLERRDQVRTKEFDEQDSEFTEIEEDVSEEMLKQCPSDMEYKIAVEKKKDRIANLLKESLDADTVMQSFEKEKEEAGRIYAAYKQAKSCQTRSIFGDLSMLLLVLAAILIPYGVMQFSGKPFTGVSVIMYLVATAVFGGLYLVLFTSNLLRAVGELRRYRAALRNLYEACRQKHENTLAAIRKRYEVSLAEIEDLRRDMREIGRRDQKNREKNLHVEQHRMMLESVENQLSGMLNSFGEKPDITVIEDVRDEFKIDKPITAVENKIYKIFSMDAIDAMFKQKGEDLRC